MKKILSALTVAAVMTACTSNPSTDTTKAAALPDTAGLAEFQAFKQQAALMKLEEMKNQNNEVAVAAEERKTTRTYATPARRTYRSRSSNYESGTMTSESGNTAKAKKGWSKAAKGAAIGAGTGAVAGAVINKRNRAVGAVIGGVLGGGVGYGIGRGMDKRDGRY